MGHVRARGETTTTWLCRLRCGCCPLATDPGRGHWAPGPWMSRRRIQGLRGPMSEARVCGQWTEQSQLNLHYSTLYVVYEWLYCNVTIIYCHFPTQGGDL